MAAARWRAMPPQACLHRQGGQESHVLNITAARSNSLPAG